MHLKLCFIFYLLVVGIASSYSQGNGKEQFQNQLPSTPKVFDQKAAAFLKGYQADSALHFLLKSQAIYEEQHLWESYIINLKNICRAYVYKNQLDSARFYLSLADKLIKEKNVQDPLANVEILDSKVFFSHVMRHPDSAIVFAKKALSVLSNNRLEEGDVKKMRLFNGIAGAYDDLGLLNRALDYYDSATFLLASTLGLDSEYASTIYYNKATTYRRLMVFDKAIVLDQKSLSILREKYSPTHPHIGINLLALGNNYMLRRESKEDLEKALMYFKESEKILTSPEGESSLFYIYNALGETYRELGEFNNSLKYINKGINSIEKFYGEEYVDLGLLYWNLGQTQTALGDYKGAEKSYTLSLKIFGRNPLENFREIGGVNTHLGDLKKRQRNLEGAIKSYQTALNALVADFNDSSVLANPKVNLLKEDNYLLEVLVKKAELLEILDSAFQKQQYADKALETYLLAAQLAKSSRKGMLTVLSKLKLNERTAHFYENAVELAVKLYEEKGDDAFLAKALTLVEDRKSSLLLDNLQTLEAKSFSNIPLDLLKKEEDLKYEIENVKNKIRVVQINPNTSKGTDELTSLKEKLFTLNNNYELLVRSLNRRFPNYYNLRYSQNTMDYLSFSDKMPEKQAIVEYFVGKDNFYTFLVQSGDIKYIQSPAVEELENRCKSYIISINKNDLQKQNLLANEIAAIVIRPILKLLSENVTHLTIVPDAYLHYIPYEVLPTSSKNNFYSTKHDYLIHKFTISYHNSIYLLSRGKDTTDELHNFDFLGFAPTFSRISNPLRATRSSRDVKIANMLDQLPNAITEVEILATLLDGKHFVQDDATEENFKKLAPNTGIIHLATHTIIDNENPLYSKLVFTPGIDDSEDGLLHTYELYNMKLNAKLACLSACNTGFGEIQNGEGVVSIARGFMYAGVPNIMMSLWSVPDQSTSEIMVYFYEELKKGHGKADALRNAKLRYLELADENTSMPYYWAAFTLIGDNEPIYFPSKINFGIVISSCIAIFLSISIALRYNRRRLSRKLEM